MLQSESQYNWMNTVVKRNCRLYMGPIRVGVRGLLWGGLKIPWGADVGTPSGWKLGWAYWIDGTPGWRFRSWQGLAIEEHVPSLQVWLYFTICQLIRFWRKKALLCWTKVFYFLFLWKRDRNTFTCFLN